MKVLVVEDHDDARDMLVTVLGLHGMDGRGAGAGQEALDVASDWRPDAAIVDFVLPDMDGCELARRLRADDAGRGMLLMALTGHSDEQTARAARDAGFDHFFVKPVDIEAVLQALAQARPPQP